ncbi:MAG: type II secretion system F family protein [Candidatus Latescibacteria bacterium]|nr:type II secretion system F family protein [Candidatus Latescibacterota bacterium]
MPLFRYRVRNREGIILNGTLEGVDLPGVIERLDTLGYIPISIKEEKMKSQAGGAININIPFLKPRVKLVDLIVFTRQFVTLHKAGLPMLTAITALQAQTRSKALAKALDGVRKDLMGGITLSSALSKYPSIFNELYVNSVWGGETGGVLDDILARVADLLDHERRLRADILSALRYPIFVVLMFGVAIFVLATFVLPKFITIIGSAGGKVPTPTRILITITDALQKYWVLGLLAIGLTFVLFILFLRTKGGRLWWDQFKLKLPVFGAITYKLTLSRFARMFETLDRTGLPILRSLNLVGKTVGNAYFAQKTDMLAESVRRGRGLAAPMKEAKVFPPMVVQMVATGEESGSLDDMLRQVSDFYDSEIEYAVKNLTSMIEPILIMILGVGAVFVILAIIMPYMSILSQLAR